MPLISWFTAPYCGSNMFRQTVATMIGGIDDRQDVDGPLDPLEPQPVDVEDERDRDADHDVDRRRCVNAHHRLNVRIRTKSKFGMTMLLSRIRM